MDLVQAVVYGIVQGLTEFLPISSSGHLLLLPIWTGWKHDPGAGFTAVIQLGTILAVLIYFRQDLGRMYRALIGSLKDKSLKNSPDGALARAVLIGTLPIVTVGLLLEKKIDSDFRSPLVVGIALIVFGAVLFASERFGRQSRSAESVTLKDGLVIGLWQCLALVPGSSRSGSTIAGGLFSGLDRSSAARFSFLLSIPAITLSGSYKLVKERHQLLEEGALSTIVAAAVSFVIGYWAIAFLMKFLQNRPTTVFVMYRFALGTFIIVWFCATHW